MTSLALRAMQFATVAHAGQARKYTGVPYMTHLAEVAGIVASASFSVVQTPSYISVSVAWLHDVVEDTPVSLSEVYREFGPVIGKGVEFLSDLETGNRADRKAASRARLAAAPGWVQTIKCADLISNTTSIRQFDPKFAVTYLAEKRALLAVLTRAHPTLHAIASELAK